MKKTDEIKNLIESNYKNTKVHAISLSDMDMDYLLLKCTTGRNGIHPFIAQRILNTYPDIRVVHFTGGWMEAVYTRETLKYCGYKIKNHGEV